MSAPFRLRVDPAATEQASRDLQRLAAAVAEQGAAVGAVAGGLAAGWQGTAATSATAEVEGLGRLLGRSADPLAAAAGALGTLAAEQRRAVDVVLPALHRRWEQAEDDRRSAESRAARAEATADPVLPAFLDPARISADRIRRQAEGALQAEHGRLRREFDALRSELVQATRTAGRALGAAVVVPVSPAQAALLAGGGIGALLVRLMYLDVAAELAGDLPLSALRAQLRDPPQDLAATTALLERARAAGLAPREYAPTLEAFWTLTAMHRAGIDPATWDPSRGAEALSGVVERVYRYYGDLFLEDRDLQWAGMANAIGPSFAAGFADLAMFRSWAQAVQRHPLPPGVDGGAIDVAAGLTDADLRAYEERFLLMQRRIFEDQAPMHEAYRTGGMDAVRELREAGVIDARALRAWEGIASGDPARVAAGNLEHLRREQHDVIAGDYDWMRQRATGPVVTWGATLVGAPSIPGARSYPEVYPLRVSAETPGIESLFGRDNPFQGEVVVTTPLPDGNISVLEDRWRLIVNDTLPAYQAVLADPAEAERIARADVGDRIDEYRLAEKWDDLAVRMARGVDVEVRQ